MEAGIDQTDRTKEAKHDDESNGLLGHLVGMKLLGVVNWVDRGDGVERSSSGGRGEGVDDGHVEV